MHRVELFLLSSPDLECDGESLVGLNSNNSLEWIDIAKCAPWHSQTVLRFRELILEGGVTPANERFGVEVG